MELIVFTEPQQGASYDDQLRVAKAAEELGFAGFFRSDHYLHMAGVDPAPGPTDSWTTLAGLARETERIRLGTLVSSATFRYPGLLAIQVAQVDQMSGGRAELGIGTGWYEAEHKAYAVPFPGLRERFDRLAEQLAVILGLWQNPDGERFGFHGTYYDVDDSPGLPKPVQRPHPPVIIGGMGKRRTPELAAAHADEFNAAFVPVGDATRQYARVNEACGQANRDLRSMRFSTALATFCGKDDAEVRRRMEASWSGPVDPDSALVGTPGRIVDRIGAYADAGAKRVYLQVLDLHDPEHLELIASEVLPQVG